MFSWIKLAVIGLSLLAAALKAAVTFVVYRQGEKAQADKDTQATLKEVADAKAIGDAVDAKTHDGRVSDLSRFVRPDPKG